MLDDVDHQIKPLAKTHTTYLQDTGVYTDILVTIDLYTLYTNIPQSDGIESLKEALEKRKGSTNKLYHQLED